MLTSAALVLMMTIPGLALFYGGMVRKKNVLATVMQSFAITGLITVLWMVIGYSLAFTDGLSVDLADCRVMLHGMEIDSFNGLLANDDPESVYMCFQMTFAIITPALICGAFADRMKFSAMMWFMGPVEPLSTRRSRIRSGGRGGFPSGAGVLDLPAARSCTSMPASPVSFRLVLGKRKGYPTSHAAAQPGADLHRRLPAVGRLVRLQRRSAAAAGASAGMAMAATQIATATRR